MYLALGKFVLQKKSQLFTFLRTSKRIEKEALASAGVVEVKLIGVGVQTFYTATLWESEEDMKAFAHSGEHLAAIKTSQEMASEMRFVFYEANKIPSKKEIEKILNTHPKVRVYSLFLLYEFD